MSWAMHLEIGEVTFIAGEGAVYATDDLRVNV